MVITRIQILQEVSFGDKENLILLQGCFLKNLFMKI